MLILQWWSKRSSECCCTTCSSHWEEVDSPKRPGESMVTTIKAKVKHLSRQGHWSCGVRKFYCSYLFLNGGVYLMSFCIYSKRLGLQSVVPRSFWNHVKNMLSSHHNEETEMSWMRSLWEISLVWRPLWDILGHFCTKEKNWKFYREWCGFYWTKISFCSL